MATVSYNRPVTINPDWGVKNLLHAVRKGDQLKDISEVDATRSILEMNKPFSPELKRRIKEKFPC